MGLINGLSDVTPDEQSFYTALSEQQLAREAQDLQNRIEAAKNAGSKVELFKAGTTIKPGEIVWQNAQGELQNFPPDNNWFTKPFGVMRRDGKIDDNGKIIESQAAEIERQRKQSQPPVNTWLQGWDPATATPSQSTWEQREYYVSNAGPAARNETTPISPFGVRTLTQREIMDFAKMGVIFDPEGEHKWGIIRPQVVGNRVSWIITAQLLDKLMSQIGQSTPVQSTKTEEQIDPPVRPGLRIVNL